MNRQQAIEKAALDALNKYRFLDSEFQTEGDFHIANCQWLESLDALEKALALPDTAEPVACECDTGREQAMRVVSRNPKGIPTVWCDPCIFTIVKALNDGGIPTVASCCGHNKQSGIISLSDGRELLVLPDYESARHAERHPPKDTAERDALANRVDEAIEREEELGFHNTDETKLLRDLRAYLTSDQQKDES